MRLVRWGFAADGEAMEATRCAPVRLVRRVIDVDGRAVGVAAAGRGVPLVVVHGFGVESLLYAQTLARLVGLGFRVIAIDLPGHGASAGLHPTASLDDFINVVDAAVAKLGIRHAVFMGHSMGGRIIAELAAQNPQRCIAAILLDPIVGQPWDDLCRWLRWFPPAMAVYGAAAAIDVASTLPALVDRGQAIKIGSRARQSITSLITGPWNGLIAGGAVLRSGPSTAALERLRRAKVAAFVVQADHDLLVPQRAAHDAAARLEATFVAVEGAGHSWMVRDPEALPAILEQLLNGRLGVVLEHAGLRGDHVTADVAMLCCIEPESVSDVVDPIDVVLASQRRPPKLKFTVQLNR